jgi:hypothetical protein
MFIPDPSGSGFSPIPAPDLGSRGQKGTGFRIRIRNAVFLMFFFFSFTVIIPLLSNTTFLTTVTQKTILNILSTYGSAEPEPEPEPK